MPIRRQDDGEIVEEPTLETVPARRTRRNGMPRQPGNGSPAFGAGTATRRLPPGALQDVRGLRPPTPERFSCTSVQPGGPPCLTHGVCAHRAEGGYVLTAAHLVTNEQDEGTQGKTPVRAVTGWSNGQGSFQPPSKG